MSDLTIGSKSNQTRHRDDVYRTEISLIKETLKYVDFSSLKDNEIINILDPAAGDGRWGMELYKYISLLYPNKIITLDLLDINEIKLYKNYEELSKNMVLRLIKISYVNYQSTKRYDIIATNPPYKKSSFNGKQTPLSEIYVYKSQELLSINGILLLFLRDDFKTGQDRFDTIHKNYMFKYYICPVKRPSFYKLIKDNKTISTNMTHHGTYVWHNNNLSDTASFITILFNYLRDNSLDTIYD